MQNEQDIARIAKGLTAAGRRYLTDKAEWRSPTGYSDRRWMTFPPSNTHRILFRLGLADGSGQISRLGIAVRDHLIKQDKSDD